MAEAAREVWITGVGIVSCLGEGPQVHWQKLMEARPSADTTTFAPYVVHPLAPVNFDAQIPKKGDQRQMEAWQRIGTYAAGLALDPAAFLNERLMSDLRPTLFLAQLSNLLAGNISIVHGVTGSSRTFMGEESSGVDAVRIALSRIVAGQSDIALVGGSLNGERPDVLLLYEFAGLPLKDRHVPIWERGDKGGFALGSLGAFLVIEAREHAEKRGAKPLARLTAVLSDRSKRTPGSVTAALGRLWDKIKPRLRAGHAAVLSGATGAAPATAEERAFLSAHDDLAVRATGSYLGHGMEPQFPMNVALAAVAVSHGNLFPPCDSTGLERPMSGELSQVVVTGVGHWRGEALALVERVG